MTLTAGKNIPLPNRRTALLLLATLLVLRSKLLKLPNLASSKNILLKAYSHRPTKEETEQAQQQLYFDEADGSKTLLIPTQSRVSKVCIVPVFVHPAAHPPLLTPRFASPEDAYNLSNALAYWRNTTRIQHLSIQTTYKASTPFLDDLVAHLPSLVYLHCGFGTYSQALFPNLPAALHTLQLQSHWSVCFSPFPIESAVAAVARARIGHSHLSELVIMRHADKSELREVEEACKRSGVGFKCVPSDYVDLLQ